MKDVTEVWIVYDVNQANRSHVVGIFPDKYSAEKFEWEYKTSRTTFPQEYRTEVLKYDFPYNVIYNQSN